MSYDYYRHVLADYLGCRLFVRNISKKKTIVLQDYNTNPDVYKPQSPLSHALLIKAYIEGNYPE